MPLTHPHLRFKAGNAVTLLENGVQLFPALCEAFDKATRSIHVETYIFRLDAAGRQILHHLKLAALRGVRVRVMLDGFGSAQDEQAIQTELLSVGAQCRIYRPEPRQFTLKSFDFKRLRRLHRKIVVVDSRVAFIGGINFEDDYLTPELLNRDVEGNYLTPELLNRESDPRFDYAVQLTGPVVADAVHAQDLLWLRLNWRLLLRGPRTWRHLRFRHQRHRAALYPATGNVQAALVLRDNLRYRKAIETAYLEGITQAQHTIIIANAYFLPERKLRYALIEAAQRGVKVKLLLQGKIEYRMQYHATRWIYDQFLGAGIEIYEYLPSFLHAKVAVLDEVSTVGSSNLDPFSLLLAREANVLIDDAAFTQSLRQSLEAAIVQGSKVIEHTLYARRPVLTRLTDGLAYLLLRVGVALTGKGSDY
ncbi:MAG: phospholipase D-like domain-containing protein [Burkholderiaceae bacterium]|nr:phospholipase D-like domain-containing protein [Burkholderiaceae bacterium]